MKTMKFLATWALHIALFYAWLVLGYPGAYNIIAAVMVFGGLMLLLGNFLPDEKLREIAGRRHWFRTPIGTALGLAEIAILFWVDHVWLASLYTFAWGLFTIRTRAACDSPATTKGAA